MIHILEGLADHSLRSPQQTHEQEVSDASSSQWNFFREGLYGIDMSKNELVASSNSALVKLQNFALTCAKISSTLLHGS